MANSSQTETRMHHDGKQWQHCSLFNLDLFTDEHQQTAVNNKDINDHATINPNCCSSSTPNVDEALSRKNLNHSCSFAVLQKNYTTKLEHVAERLLANENKNLNDCSCCQLDTTTDGKAQSLNRKILLGSTAILDNFLRNSLKSPLTINSNSSTSSNGPVTQTSAAATVHIASTVSASTSNQRRWHSERGSRHPNVRANLPLTPAQRQVLQRYMNYPMIKPPTQIRSHRRSHQPITGKAVENTGTALSALSEQISSTIIINHSRKESLPSMNAHPRPLSSTSSTVSAVSHHSTLNRRCFLADTVLHHNQTNEESETKKDSDSDSDDEDDQQSIESESDDSTDEEIKEAFRKLSITNPLTNIALNSSEILHECCICCESKRLQTRNCCDFSTCSTCLSTYVEEKIKQGIIRIQCPNQQCHVYMHVDEIHKRCVNPEIRLKFTRLFTEMNRSINMKTCPRCSRLHEIGKLKDHTYSTLKAQYNSYGIILIFRLRTFPIEKTCTDKSTMC